MKKRKKGPARQFIEAKARAETNCERMKGLVANQRPGYKRNINEIMDDTYLQLQILDDLYFDE